MPLFEKSNLPDVKKTTLVASGNGGIGKPTVTYAIVNRLP